MTFKPCRTICTLQKRNIWVSSRGSKAGARNSAGQEKIGVSGQEVKVVKTHGKTYEGRLSTISETKRELDRTGGKLEIAKADLAQVYHLRPKPLNDSEKYSAQEDFWIDPRLWALLPPSRSQVACAVVRLIATRRQYACQMRERFK